MKAVLVGGAGFIGVNLARALVGRGWDVVIAARPGVQARKPAICSEIARLGARLHETFYSREDLVGLGGDVYYHLAGTLAVSRERMWDAHVHLLDRLVSAASELGARVIYVSAIVAIGRVRGMEKGSVVVEEDRHLEPGRHEWSNPFELSKAEGERLLVRRGKELEGKWAIVRPGLVVGPWAYHSEWKLIYYASKLRVYPDTPPIPITPVSDLAEILAGAGEGSFDGQWLNAVAYNRRLSEITEVVCRELSGSRCVGVNVGGLARILGTIAQPIPAVALFESMVSRGYRYSSRILSGRTWTEPEEAAKAFVRWAKELGGVKA